MEYLCFINFQIVKCEFRQPLANKFCPLAQFRMACSGYKANVYSFLNRQRILSIASVFTYKDTQFGRKHRTPRNGGNRS